MIKEFISDKGELRILDFDKNFISSWITRAEEESLKGENANLMKFFCYFIAFNSVYSSFGYANYNFLKKKYPTKITRIDSISERMMIRELIFLIKDSKMESFKNWTPFAYISKEGLMKGVIPMRFKSEINQKMEQGYIRQKNEDLFLQIYTVRCNLFHGSKQMETLRDKKLIEDCNNVLKDFLERLIQIL